MNASLIVELSIDHGRKKDDLLITLSKSKVVIIGQIMVSAPGVMNPESTSFTQESIEVLKDL